MTTFSSYFDLVQRLSTSDLNRSENDLSSSFKSALEECGLHALLDTGGGDNRRVRPDISLYTDLASADAASAAEVVIEAKRPGELRQFASLDEAIISDWLWTEKFVPYVRAHAERVRFFLLTTFERVLVVPISDEVRRSLTSDTEIGSIDRLNSITGFLEFNLRHDARAFEDWARSYLCPSFLQPLPFSALLNLRPLVDSDDLEGFAIELAELVAGAGATGLAQDGSTLLSEIAEIESLDALPQEVRRSLVIYTMSTNGGLSIESAERYLQAHFRRELGEFVGASVHSLISRLFAVKVLEDAFCVGVVPPLVPASLWIFNSDRLEDIPSDALPTALLEAIDQFGRNSPPAIRDFATSGRFYDWVRGYLDEATFRRLVELFVSHDFRNLDGDLLGRFFELYSQKVDRRRRRALGQYYTPLPIVRFLWRRAMEIVREEQAESDLIVLDPSVGSGTFLSEGVGHLSSAGISEIWEKLFGFDISPQVIGIAQINLYLSVLGSLTRSDADSVGTLGLYPTDTLDPTGGQRLQSIMSLLTDDTVLAFIRARIELSEHVKRRDHFPLVIGNPPYRHNPERTLTQISDVFPSLLRSTRENLRAQENTIREDYAWFFAAADYYTADRGVIAFVVSDSFCYARSFRYFREDLLRKYCIRSLVRLGKSAFPDVGPRISFAMVVLQRRQQELSDASRAEAIQFCDLRHLISGTEPELATEADPRFAALESDQLDFVEHIPTRNRDFAFFPAGESAQKVLQFPTKLVDSPRRVFTKKWPGAVSGFDKVFKSKNKDDLQSRMQLLFQASELEESARTELLQRIALECRLSENDSDKLAGVADLIASIGLRYDPQKISRAITGSAPNDCTWYPDERMMAWIYYEPRIVFERAVHEGRNQGWGTSNQWREPESHLVSPKFVFTTSTNPERGLKAFVLPDAWIVLKGAGLRQQLNYTALDNPLTPQQIGPNNLGAEAEQLFNAMQALNATEDDFLLYLAALYNSEIAERYLHEGGESSLRIPLDPACASAACELAGLGRVVRDLRRLDFALAFRQELPAALADVSEDRIESFGIVEMETASGRFRAERQWAIGDDAKSLIAQEISTISNEIDQLVEDLYSNFAT